ncbi:MAG: hypothetical protein VX341_11910 [Bdellovibrionota bacterium]|nr:hypothetical protein [Bdellovibrionota bacterium]
MKKFFSTLLIATTLMSVSVQSTQAAWVIGAAASFENSDFSREVERLAYRTAVISGLLGLITGSSFLATVFILSDEDPSAVIADQIYKAFEVHKEITESEIVQDLAKMMASSDAPTKKITVKDDKGEDVEIVTFSFSMEEDEVNSLLEKHGLDIDATYAQELRDALK